METFTDLIATGDVRYLVLALVGLAAGGLLIPLAVHLRPRPRRRAAR